MKVFSVVGYTKSGKTTSIEGIVRELKHRGYSVGTVKDIHFEEFAIDREGTNTHRHKTAGAELVTARGLHETDILFQEKLDIYKIASFYDTDYLVLEGVRDANVPKILTSDCLEDLENQYDGRVFLISGKIADEIDHFKNIEAISIFGNVGSLVDRIEAMTFPLLPDFDPKCCSACGYDCRTLCKKIVSGEKTYDDCIVNNTALKLTVNGKPIQIVSFVEKILQNNIMAVVSELDGYENGGSIEINWGKPNVKS